MKLFSRFEIDRAAHERRVREELEKLRRLPKEPPIVSQADRFNEMRKADEAAKNSVKAMGDNRGLPLAKDIAGRPDPKQPLKYDSGEAPMYRGALWYFPMALNEVARVSAAGAKKYNWNKGWLAGQDAFARYSDALVRHMGKEAYSRLDDGPKGTGLLHAAHTAWNALARLEVMLYAEGLLNQGNDHNATPVPSPAPAGADAGGSPPGGLHGIVPLSDS